MNNRKKLTDDQLDAVSGGDTMRENAENSKKLDQMICPLCGREVSHHVDSDMFTYLLCYTCNVTWTHYHGYWERYVKSSSSC